MIRGIASWKRAYFGDLKTKNMRYKDKRISLSQNENSSGSSWNLPDKKLLYFPWRSPPSKTSSTIKRQGKKQIKELPFAWNAGMFLDRADSTNFTRSLPENSANDTTLWKMYMLNDLIKVELITRELAQLENKRE